MMIMNFFVSLSFFFLIATLAFGSNPESAAIQAYVQEHHDIAVQEMKRSGIPASILLAQAILATENGSAALVANNNNHFAMKCGHAWTGETVFQNDGQAITEACYRAYPDAASSYSDYTNLMMEDRSCRNLFQHSYYDYKSWAEGIQKCLQPDQKKYADIIVKLIKKFDLAKYDSSTTFSPAVTKPIIGYEFEIN